MATMTGVLPLTDARTRRRVPALGAAATGANGVAGTLPDAPLEIGDAVPFTGGPGGPNPAFTSAGPAGRAEGTPGLTPQPPSPVAGMMPAAPPSGGFPLAGGYATATPYGPGNDLRGTAILPGASARTQAATGLADAAMGRYAGAQLPAFQAVGGGTYAPSADTAGLRASLSQALGALQNGPDRGQLAAQNFALLDQTAREASNRDLRVIGQDAAKFGRIGSGITTTNLGDLGERQALARSRAQEQMALDAAGQTMGDRLNVAGAIGSGFGALTGADLSNAGFTQSLRNELRGERDAGNQYAQQGFNNTRSQFGDLAGYAQQGLANDAAFRDEARGERGYQGGMENQAYTRYTGAIDRGQAQTANAFNQGLGLLNAGAGASSPYLNTLAGAGANASAQGAQGMDAIYQLLARYYGGGG